MRQLHDMVEAFILSVLLKCAIYIYTSGASAAVPLPSPKRPRFSGALPMKALSQRVKCVIVDVFINFKEAVKNARTDKGTERVPELGPDTFIAYGCSAADGCGIHSLRANHWYRLFIAPGANGCYSNGFWACAHCTKRQIPKREEVFIFDCSVVI